MKLLEPYCPECGALAIGQMDYTPGLAYFSIDEDGTFRQWDGETEMFWDGQTEHNDLLYPGENLGVRISCGLHEWDSPVAERANPNT